MKITKKHIELLFAVLEKTEPNLVDARIRDNVMRQIKELYPAYNQDRKNILEKFCDKDEEENPIVQDGKYSYKPEVIGELNKEIEVFGNEEIEISTNDTAKIKELIENTTYSPKFGEVEIIDNIMQEVCR